MTYKNRPSGKRGGIAIYSKDNITFKCRPDIEINIDGEFESIFIETTNKKEKIIVGEIYRVPNTNEQLSIHRFETILENLRHIKTKVILGTDQNLYYLKIETQNNTRELLNNFLSSGMQPTITKPTRVTHSTATLIDNIYVNLKQNVNNIKSGTILCDISDHFPIFMFYGKVIRTKNKHITFKSRLLNERSMQLISNSLANVDWSTLDNKEIDNAHAYFIKTLNDITDQHAPMKILPSTPRTSY